MEEISPQNYFYKTYDLDSSRSFSKEEVLSNDENLTKSFISSDPSTQREILRKIDQSAKNALLDSLKKHYQYAGDNGSKSSCEKAILTTAANIIPAGNDFQELAANVLIFMHKNIKYRDNVNNPGNRDACQWSGTKVLAEGNYNGCAEAAKLFLELYKEACLQKRFSAVECNYTSSFLVSAANQETINSKESPPGHAVIELKQGGIAFLVNAAWLESPILGGTRPTIRQLEDSNIILHADQGGFYKMEIEDNKIETFKLFGKGRLYDAQGGPNGSDQATINAMLEFIQQNPPILP